MGWGVLWGCWVVLKVCGWVFDVVLRGGRWGVDMS